MTFAQGYNGNMLYCFSLVKLYIDNRLGNKRSFTDPYNTTALSLPLGHGWLTTEWLAMAMGIDSIGFQDSRPTDPGDKSCSHKLTIKIKDN